MLEKDAQTSPVADVQAPEAPHTQGAGLAVAPSPWAQTGPLKEPTMKLLELLHWRMGPLQKSPVEVASQSVVPHAQFAELAAVLSVVAHNE